LSDTLLAFLLRTRLNTSGQLPGSDAHQDKRNAKIPEPRGFRAVFKSIGTCNLPIMKPTDDLFQLIHSLSKSEKGYFKKFCAIHAPGQERSYLKLFQAIARQETYNEAALKQSLQEESFLHYLSTAKNYLHSLILKSLRSYNEGADVDELLLTQLRDFEILFSKGLFQQCSKVLRKAQSLAAKHDRHLLLLQAYKLQVKLNESQPSEEKHRQISEENYKSQQKLIQEYSELIEYQKLLNDFISYSNILGGTTRKKEHVLMLDQIIEAPPLQRNEQELPFRSRIIYYYCWGLYHHLQSDFTKAYKVQVRCRDFLNAHPEKKKEAAESYAGILNNLINTLLALEEYEESYAVLQEYKKLESRSLQMQVRVFQVSSLTELFLAEATGEFEKGIAAIPQIEQRLKEYKGKLNKINELIIYFNISTLYFAAGEFSKSLFWRNKLVANCDPTVREDIFCASKILNLVNHFELGNTDILEYVLRSTYRYLYQKKRIYNHEKLILVFIRKLCDITTNQELKELFTGLKKALIDLQQDPYEKSPFYFDLISWLESKITQTPFRAIVQEKIRNKRKAGTLPPVEA